MRKYLILFFFTLTGCENKSLTRSELVTEYYSAFNSSDFDRITTVITDSITIEEGEYVTPYSNQSFYEQVGFDFPANL